MAYAQKTSVSTDRSEVQIKGILRKHGANSILIGENETQLAIMFSMKNRQIRFVVPIPNDQDDDVKFTDSGKIREGSSLQSAIDQHKRQRYRLLFLVVKAKLEAVDSGVVAFEEEFLAHTVMSDGQSVGNWIMPQIQDMYDSGNMPPLLGHSQ